MFLSNKDYTRGQFFSKVRLASCFFSAAFLLAGTGRAAEPKPAEDQVRPLRIAVGSMITPSEGYGYYKQLLNYIGKKIGRPVKFVDRKKYSEVNALIKSRDVDMAFVCGKPYVLGHDDFGLEIIAAPQVGGATTYNSFIIVPADSAVKTLKELRGKTFAFADPDSNSGKLVPSYLLSLIGETPESFFKEFIYTYAHDKSIYAVAHNIVEGAAVDSLIWNFVNKHRPELTSRTKIIDISPPCGIPPVTVHPKMDPALKKKIKDILIHVHEDPEGRQILDSMMIEKFVPKPDHEYDFIRQMGAAVSKQAKK